MKRAVLFVASATILLCAGAQAQSRQPVFTFMGDSAAAPTSRTELAGMPCVTKGKALECGPSGKIVWRGETLNFVALTFWEGRLIRAVGAFDRARHSRVRALLREEYGMPQHAGYQSMAERPDPFTYPETIWEFDDGRLELESLTDDAAVLTFSFSVRSPPDD